jgi:hypothetical protein
MHSTDLDQFQVIALALMQIVCWLIKSGREEGEQSIVWWRRNVRGEEKIWPRRTTSSAHLLLALFEGMLFMPQESKNLH